jgi:hypothetical protein
MTRARAAATLSVAETRGRTSQRPTGINTHPAREPDQVRGRGVFVRPKWHEGAFNAPLASPAAHRQAVEPSAQPRAHGRGARRGCVRQRRLILVEQGRVQQRNSCRPCRPDGDGCCHGSALCDRRCASCSPGLSRHQAPAWHHLCAGEPEAAGTPAPAIRVTSSRGGGRTSPPTPLRHGEGSDPWLSRHNDTALGRPNVCHQVLS